MNTFASALKSNPQMSTTANGALTYSTSGDNLVDLFNLAGSSRANPSQLRAPFIRAFVDDPVTAMQAIFWMRDAREGAGERNAFRDLIKWASEQDTVFQRLMILNMAKIPFFGRWDDVLTFMGTPLEPYAVSLIALGLEAQMEKRLLLSRLESMSDEEAQKILDSLG